MTMAFITHAAASVKITAFTSTTTSLSTSPSSRTCEIHGNRLLKQATLPTTRRRRNPSTHRYKSTSNNNNNTSSSSPSRIEMNTSASTSTSASADKVTNVREFLDVVKDLGTMRFIAVTNGAVLETIGRFDYNVSTFSIPNKGEYVTIASDDKTFECHLNMDKVKRITLGTNKAKIGDHDLHVIRFFNDEDQLMLSCLLMFDPSKGPGNYLYGAVECFTEIVESYGNEITF